MIQGFPKRIIRKVITRVLAPDAQISYSQFGEDLIISYMFHNLGIKKPTYIDIGANEPRHISNTYFFYERGSRGVLVEPNPGLCKRLRSARPGDTILNSGVSMDGTSEADLYLFSGYASGLSTFSESHAKHWEEVGMKGLGKIPIDKVIRIPMISINDILEKHFSKAAPNFISLDVEGLDLDILKSMDFNRYKPDCFCVETLAYDDKQQEYKLHEINEYMTSKGYRVYADTWVNTIFLRADLLSS